MLLVVLAGIAPAAALDNLTADPARIEEMTYDLCTFERALGGSKERTAAATYIATAMEERGLSVGTGRFSYSNCYFDRRWPSPRTSSVSGRGGRATISSSSPHTMTPPGRRPPAPTTTPRASQRCSRSPGSSTPLPLNRTVYFIAFGGEETGLEGGSTRWLADNPDLHDRIVAAINLDCIASGDRLLATTLPQHRWTLDLLPPSACIEETPARLLDAARGGTNMPSVPRGYRRSGSTSATVMRSSIRPTTGLRSSTTPLPRNAHGSSPGRLWGLTRPMTRRRSISRSRTERSPSEPPRTTRRSRCSSTAPASGVLPSGSVTLPGGPTLCRRPPTALPGAKAVATVMGGGG
ncbi:M28 family peptidase [Methanoculleus chikugoensis]|uniref:M28 family peptidase n=1 Tax=Methanoculleus chikugoensis TaxID=118126 RepID=UPI0006CF8F9A|nr:M28 family peptidase [Methanoculleus chikugoensis]